MSKAANSIRKGLEEAEGHSTKFGMTQQAFAGRFGFSINTLRHCKTVSIGSFRT